MYLLDTNTVSELMKQNPVTWKKLLEKHKNEIFLCEVVVSEIFFGINLLGDTKKTRRLKKEFYPILETLEVLVWDREISIKFAEIKAKSTKTGKIVADIDLIIAAHTIRYDCTLVTDNSKDFRKIDGLKIINWKE